MNYIKYIKNTNVPVLSNSIIKKIRNNLKIIYELNVDTNKNKIINMLSDNIYEFTYFHSICGLLKIIGNDENLKYSWDNADKLMYAFTDEFNSDKKLYEIIIKLLKNNMTKNEEIFLNTLISGMKKYGTHLSNDITKKVLKMKDKIIRTNEKILSTIWNGGAIKYTKKLEKLNNLITTTSKNENIIPINKINHNFIIRNIEDAELRQYIDKTYSNYCTKLVLPIFSDLLLFRYNYARLLGYKNFFDFQVQNCMLKNEKNIMEKVKSITIKLRDEFLKDDLYKKHLTDIIYENKKKKKKLKKKFVNFIFINIKY